MQGDALDATGGSRPLALYSRPKSVTHAAKFSENQLVGFSWRVTSYDTVWQVRLEAQSIQFRDLGWAGGSQCFSLDRN